MVDVLKRIWVTHTEKSRTLLIVVAVLFLLVLTGSYGSSKARAFKMPLQAGKLEIMGFYENDGGGVFVGSAESLRKNIHRLDTVVAVWASVDFQGNIARVTSDRSVAEFVREHNRPLLVSISNAKGSATQSNYAMLQAADIRKRTVQNITTFVANQGYDGVHISFDLLPPSAEPFLSGFIEELGYSLHSQQKILGISVFPSVELPSSLWGAFSLKKLGQSADYVLLQAYERHSHYSLPGPIAPDSWVEAAVSAALKEVSAQKLILGVGLYGYSWPEAAGSEAAEYLPLHEAVSRASRCGAKVQIDPSSNQPYYGCEYEGQPRMVWYQGTQNLGSKIEIAKKHGLRGISLWRLGFEMPDVWDVVQHASAK